MTNPNDYVYPADSLIKADGTLTKREYFAALFMAQLCVNGDYEEHAVHAVANADKLIEVLNRKK